MSFERLDRSRARFLPTVSIAVLLVVSWAAALPRPAQAAPLDEPFVGGMSFSGPTSGNLAAVYWNPAALGLMRGVTVMVSASGRLATTRATLGLGQGTAHDLTQPVQWPLGPNGFAGIAWDLGSDRFTLAFATYTPSVEQIHFPNAPQTRDEPTRYHALDIDLRNLALVPALSIRFAGDFRVGIAPGFLFSTGRLHFAEDVGGAQNPADDARYDVDSGQGIGDAKFSVTLGGGIYFRRKSVEIGVAYSSRPIGGNVSGVEVAGERTSVALPASAGGGPVTCAGGAQTTRCVFGDLTYRLPDIWTAGATWHLGPGLELTATVRWIWFHLHDHIDLRLTGPTLEASGLPQHIVLYRGFQDVWDGRVRVAYWWRERIRVGAALRVETSAVDAGAVTPAAVDGFKLQPILLAEVKLSRHLWLGGGYGITFMPQVTVTSSRFDPTAAAACSQAGNDLANPACQTQLEGRARPSAAGTYQRTVQDFGLTLTARF